MGLVFGRAISPDIELQESITNSLNRLAKYGVVPPEKETRKGMLRRVFEGLLVGETAPSVMAYLKGEPMGAAFLETFKRPFKGEIEKPLATYSDVLEELGWRPEGTFEKFMKGAVGLGLDIVVDPKTWLTFGTMGASKLFVAGKGTVSLSDDGAKLLAKAVNQFGEEAGRKMMGSHIIQTGDKYLAKAGLKFMGAEIIPEKVVKAPFRWIDDMLEKIPISGKIYKGFKVWETKAFHPWRNIEALPATIGAEYKKLVHQFYRGTRAEQMAAINKIQDLARESYELFGPKVATNLPEYIEAGGKLTGNNFLDNLVKMFGIEHRRMIKAERLAGIPVGEIPDYIRHWLTKEGREYLGQIQDMKPVIRAITTISKRSPGFARGRSILASIADINSELVPEMARIGIKGNFFESNAFKLMAIRKAESIKAIKTANFFTEVAQRFALKPTELAPGNLAQLLGEKVIWHDGVKYVDAALSIPQLKGLFIPEAIRSHLKDTYAVISGADEPMRGFLRVYDKVLSWWKASVTGWFPAFHSRNFVGGAWNNFLLGLKDPKYYKWTQDLFSNPEGTTTLFGKKFVNKELLKDFNKAGATGQIGYADVMRTIDDMIADIGKTAKIDQVGTFFKNAPKTAMEFVENRLRIPLMLFEMDKGNSLEEAAKSVFRVHFDYAPEALTVFERNVMRRLIPFYTWTRHNIPLQFEMLLKQPGKYAGLEKLRRSIEAISGTEKVAEERKYLPSWIKEMFTIRLPWIKATGEPYYLQMDLPVEDLNKLSIREIVAMLSPLLKYPIEKYVNKNLYFDTPIYDENLPREYQAARTVTIMKNLPEPIKKFLNIQEGKRKNFFTGEFEPVVTIDAQKLYFIRSLFLSRFYSTLTGWLDPEVPIEEKITRWLIGEPIRPLDISEARWRELKSQDIYLRDILYYLQRGGIIPYRAEEKRKEKLKKGLVF